MKANRSARRSVDEAVSSVVSAVLVFALFTTLFTLWTVTTLPSWVADREHAHSEGVRTAFGELASSLDTLSASEDDAAASVPLALAPAAIPLLQRGAASGDLDVAGDVSLSASFVDERLRFVNGQPVGEPDEPIDEGTGEFLDDVYLLQALVIRLTTSNVGNADRAWIQVVADDGSDTVTAIITHDGKTSGSGPNVAGCLNSELRLEVLVDIDPAPVTTSTQALLCELANDLTGYSLDLADNFYPFLDAVERLDTPYTIALTDDSSGGSASAEGFYASSYLDSDDQERGTGGGQSVDYELDLDGSRLVYDASYQEYADQELAWELGGVLVTQEDGQAVALPPHFELASAGGTASLAWTLVELTGDGSHSGRGQATARIQHLQTTDLVLEAEGATFTLTSPAAAAWRSHFAAEALLAGLEGDVTAGGTGTTATLALGNASVTSWTIHLRLVEASLEVL